MSIARSFCVFSLLTAILAGQALGGGFQLNEQGARAMAQGGAFAARANDLSAIFFNPAGLAYQKGLGAYVGGTMILPKGAFTNPTTGKTTDMVSLTFVIPSVYLGYGMENGLAFGVGFYAPYGLGTEWPAGWEGRYKALKTDLQHLAINPTIAYRVNDNLMIGAGMSYTWSTAKLSYNIPTYSSLAPPTPATTDGLVLLDDASGSAFSFNLGAIYKPMPELSIGASYRHSAKTELEGVATITNAQALSSFFPGGAGKTSINFPNQIFAGLSYDISKNFTLEVDYQWIGWSTYDTLTVELPNGPTFPLTGQPLQKTSKSAKDWTNTYMIRSGAEYRYESFAFRLGIIYDATPQPNATVEPMLADANRIEGTIGLGYRFSESWSVDVAYQFISFQDRTVTGPTTGDMNKFPGTYKNSANLFGLSVAYGM